MPSVCIYSNLVVPATLVVDHEEDKDDKEKNEGEEENDKEKGVEKSG